MVAGPTAPSGAFSRQCALLLGHDKGFTCVSWNARALAHTRGNTKGKVLTAGQVIALQEVRGTEADMEIYFRQFSSTHKISYSAVPEDASEVAAGGVATLFSLCAEADLKDEIIVLGRILPVAAKVGEKTSITSTSTTSTSLLHSWLR